MAKEKENKVEQGIYVVHAYETNDEGEPTVLAFTGTEFAAEVTPNGDLAIFELSPDVSGKNKGNPIPRVRRFIAKGCWADCIVV